MQSLAQWAYVFAAALFGAIALGQIRRSTKEAGGQPLALALAITAATSLLGALVPAKLSLGAMPTADVALSQLRHIAWLGFVYLLWREGAQGRKAVGVGMLYIVVASVFFLLSGLSGLIEFKLPYASQSQAILLTSAALNILSIVGALVLVHNLYTAASPEAREGLRLPLLGIAAMWVYDLNLYTITYLTRSWPADLFSLHGIALTLVAPVFGLAVLRNRPFTVQLSRTVALQSVSLVAIGIYLSGMAAITFALDLIGGEAGRLAQISFVFAASLAALILVPSARFRAWFRVKVTKHLFRHRYDYRSEWLRFTQTIGRPGQEAAALEERVIQAVGEILESPSGLLLTPDANALLLPQARWNWTLNDPPAIGASARLANYLEHSGRVLELDKLRSIGQDNDNEAALVPEWILEDKAIWAIIPLVHFQRLAGVILLTRPLENRDLDWEDFDLLRVAGPQVASYLAEARTQEALSDARRFDEFNRRFAFIMHDIKNLVSQLSLLTRNAERHADNPEFRADMIETLKSSTARMNALLARLSQHNKGKPEEVRPIRLAAVAEQVASAKKSQHPVVVVGDFGLRGLADPARLEQALGHLVQNAIDATSNGEPVTIRLADANGQPTVEVIDKGSGMSPGFINAKLFRPFTSTKEAGFGIGTFEARSVITEMGGRLDVKSRSGVGSTFTISLPSDTGQHGLEAGSKALAA